MFVCLFAFNICLAMENLSIFQVLAYIHAIAKWCTAKTLRVELALLNYCSAHLSKWIDDGSGQIHGSRRDS